MKIRGITTLCLALSATTAFAQNNPAVPDYRTDLFQNCIQGNDLGQLTKVANPMGLLGGIAYAGPIMKPDGTTGTGWARQSMSLPIVTSDATSPDTATCQYTFESGVDGSISILGFGLNAAKTDVYKMTVRLVARQKIAPVAGGNIVVMPWQSDRYRDQFKAVLASVDPSVSTFWVFDDIAIYVLAVERYKKESAGILGAIGLFTGGGNYKRDESFSGTKIIVTGEGVPLKRSMFDLPTITAAAGTQPQIPAGTVAVQALSTADLTAATTALNAIAHSE